MSFLFRIFYLEFLKMLSSINSHRLMGAGSKIDLLFCFVLRLMILDNNIVIVILHVVLNDYDNDENVCFPSWLDLREKWGLFVQLMFDRLQAFAHILVMFYFTCLTSCMMAIITMFVVLIILLIMIDILCWCRTLGKVRTSGVERGTLSAFEDFLCALVKVLSSDRNGDGHVMYNLCSKLKCCREARTWMRC